MNGVEVTESHEAVVGDLKVRRALPRRARRTVGAWCFLDHMGPADFAEDEGIDIGPHPHIGLQTVTWLRRRRGAAPRQPRLRAGDPARPAQPHDRGPRREPQRGAHRQLPGQPPRRPAVGGPARGHPPRRSGLRAPRRAARRRARRRRRHGPRRDLAGATSPARRDTDHVGAASALRPGGSSSPSTPPTSTPWCRSRATCGSTARSLSPGHLGYLGLGRDELVARGPRAGDRDARRRRALRGADPHVVELRRPRREPRSTRRGASGWSRRAASATSPQPWGGSRWGPPPGV